MFEMYGVIKEKIIMKAKSILAQKTIELKEYNDNCGRQKMKNIIQDNNLNREQKELLLKQINGELNTQENKKKLTQTLTRLRDLQP